MERSGCAELTKLNGGVQRERHMMPTVEHTYAQVQQGTVFSKLDANSGFWQVVLAPESQLFILFMLEIN